MESRGDYETRLKAVASRLRESGGLGRSEPLMRLFDYLLDRSLVAHVPKEIEIAQEVFGKDADFDIMQDASVRVYIHRLRRKLEEFNSRLGAGEDRILLPLGEYQLTLAPAATTQEPATAKDPAVAALEPFAPRSRWRSHQFAIVLAAILTFNLAVWLIYIGVRGPQPMAPVAASPLWRPISEGGNPTFIVTGDYYLFGDAPDTFNVTRLVRDFTVNSRDDLDQFMMSHPEARDHYINLDLYYLPVSIGPALRELLPAANATAGSWGPLPMVTRMSQFSGEMLKNANVVYLGFLSGLGILRDPLFKASGFKIGENFDELIDKKSGRKFDSDWGVVVDGKASQRDYAYIASIPGPSGKRIIIISGTRDAAVVQAAQIVVDPEQLDAIAAKAKGDAFEALYEVRTLGNVNLGSSLVIARSIQAGDIWHPEE